MISHDTLVEIVPIFVAIMVWLIRVLIIGTFSVAGNRLFSQADTTYHAQPVPVMHRADGSGRPTQAQPITIRPLSKPSAESNRRPQGRPEPTYHPAGMSGYKPSNNQTRQ